MKKVFAGKLLPIALLVLLIFNGCQKDNTTTPIKISTSEVSNIGATSADCGGKISSIGSSAITELGVCISTLENPTITDFKITGSTDSRDFTVTATNLSQKTTYHVRAFATNATGTSYGEDVSFTTLTIPVPTISTTAISNISYFSAKSGGVITIYGGVVITDKGICWSTNAYPTIADSKISNGGGGDSFTDSIPNLSYSTTYHVRAYATFAAGIAYGEDVSFKTLTPVFGAPTLTTTSISSITATTANSGGTIIFDGGQAITAKGVCWSTSSNPTIADSKTSDGTGTGTYISNMSGLASNTYYHVRAYATNSVGTSYGSDIMFKTAVVISTPAENMLLGNPSGATTNILTPDNYFIEKPYYSFSYNNTKHTVNWTSWHLYSEDIGSAPRPNPDVFNPDPDLPTGWYRVVQNDYSYSTYGFERGHMCPVADRTSSPASVTGTFFMTNMVPQSPNNNSGPWGAFEDYCRNTLVGAGNELYIICGPYGMGGTSASGSTPGTTITNYVNGVGAVNITVPAYTWKIVVVLSNGNDDINRITTSTRVIAVKMPNTVDCNAHDWKYYRTSVDALETLTGYDFLSNVPTSIQNVIEAVTDNQ